MNKGSCFMSKKDSIYNTIKQNEGLCIVYGATLWGRMLVSEDIHIDYFCDKKADEIQDIGGIPVIDCETLEKYVINSGKRATIIICVGINKSTINSIYRDLVKLNIPADIFDYFENEEIFKCNSFRYRQEKYLLYEHPYNCGYVNSRMTERGAELALAKKYIDKCDEDIMEIGAVTPYYFYDKKISDVVDPTDIHKRVNLKKSLFECNLTGKNILSISTVEHVGLSDYGMAEERTCIEAIEKIVSESKSCMITAPLGYNPLLDNWVRNNRNNPMIRILKRKINNQWEEIDAYDYEEIIYSPLWACGLLVVEKG